MINKIEYHEFIIRDWDLPDQERDLLTFYATKEPFKVYRQKRYELEEIKLD